MIIWLSILSIPGLDLDLLIAWLWYYIGLWFKWSSTCFLFDIKITIDPRGDLYFKTLPLNLEFTPKIIILFKFTQEKQTLGRIYLFARIWLVLIQLASLSFRTVKRIVYKRRLQCFFFIVKIKHLLQRREIRKKQYYKNYQKNIIFRNKSFYNN